MYIKEPTEKAQAVVIWLHGLGSHYQDMETLSQNLNLSEPLRHVYLQAPERPITINGGQLMPAWYDVKGLPLMVHQELTGILQSCQTVEEAIQRQITDGFSSEQIYLAGFSQGAAVALFSAICCKKRLGGVISLSGYLPCVDELSFNQPTTLPVFFGVGLHDEIVLPHWSHVSFQFLKKQSYHELILQDYNMAHAVCSEELKDLSTWLSERIQINNQRVLMLSEGL
jgi:phospholipase/carboxylesterase